MRDEHKNQHPRDSRTQSSQPVKTAWLRPSQGSSQDENKNRVEKQTVEFTLWSIIAAFTKTNIIALPCQVRKCKISLALDTGARINNVISEPSFRQLRGTFRGGRCRLLHNDMTAVGVMRYNLEILGKVLFTVQPSKKVSAFCSYFYITKTLALPVDALLGLTTMRELGILISPDSNEIIYEGKPLKETSNPSWLAFLDSPLTGEQTVSPIVAKQRLGGGKGHWPTVSAKVEKTQEIPDRAAKIITIRVDKAQVESDACIDGAPNTCHIAVKSTLSERATSRRSW